MGYVTKPSKPFNHEADTLEESCGITGESYRRFCKAFDAIVGEARKHKPLKRSREIEAFEQLMLAYPREVGFYITDLIADLAECDYLRTVLRRLLREPEQEPEKKDGLETMDCAGSA